MIRSVRPIAIVCDTVEKMPNGIQPNKSYPVVVERSVKKVSKKDGKESEFEDLELGVINDENKVVFVAMYRVHVHLS